MWLKVLQLPQNITTVVNMDNVISFEKPPDGSGVGAILTTISPGGTTTHRISVREPWDEIAKRIGGG